MRSLLRLAVLPLVLLAGTAQAQWKKAELPEEPPSAQELATEFLRAVVVDNARTIRRLLAAGVSPNLVGTERNEPALVLALRHDSLQVFEALMEARGIDLEAPAPNGDTALMIAAYKGLEPQFRSLLAQGALINREGWSALHYAAAGGHRYLVFLLLEANAYIDAASPNGTTALMMAAREGHLDIVNLLLEEGADRTLVNQAGFDAYKMAVKFEHKAVMNRLSPH